MWEEGLRYRQGQSKDAKALFRPPLSHNLVFHENAHSSVTSLTLRELYKALRTSTSLSVENGSLLVAANSASGNDLSAINFPGDNSVKRPSTSSGIVDRKANQLLMTSSRSGYSNPLDTRKKSLPSSNIGGSELDNKHNSNQLMIRSMGTNTDTRKGSKGKVLELMNDQQRPKTTSSRASLGRDDKSNTTNNQYAASVNVKRENDGQMWSQSPSPPRSSGSLRQGTIHQSKGNSASSSGHSRTTSSIGLRNSGR
jgi:hypothetical protein